MGKLTIEALRQSYVENVKALYEQYMRAILCKGDLSEDLMDRVANGTIDYNYEVEARVIELGEDTEITLEWFREALNSIRLGEIIFEYIEGREES